MSLHNAMYKALGFQLSAEDQRYVLSNYGQRFTGNNKPNWAKQPMPNGDEYPVQFKDDQDWLANTYFAVTKEGRLNKNFNHCESHPTWPNNPELRKRAA